VSAPCLLISYEKALQFPEQTVSEIASFSGIGQDDKNFSSAIGVIENGAPRYIEAARLRYQGSVGRLVKGKLRGWVKVQHQDRVRVVVELEINGAVIDTMTADRYRPDVEQAGFGDGRYGFEFPVDEAIDPKSIVNVRVQNSKILVTNSGRALQSYRFPPQ
jgi:hypothetical protein